MNIDTGEIRTLDEPSLERQRAEVGVLMEAAFSELKPREMLLPAKGPLSEEALRDKTPEDRLRILRAQEKRERREDRNLAHRKTF